MQVLLCVIVVYLCPPLVKWKGLLKKNPINPRKTILRLLEGQDTCNTGIMSF